MAHPFGKCLVPSMMANPSIHCQSLKSAHGRSEDVAGYIGILPEERLTALPPVNYSKGEGPTFTTLYRPGCSSCENRLLEYRVRTPPPPLPLLIREDADDDENHDPARPTNTPTTLPPSTTTTTTVRYVEFLEMEFARDVTFASTATETTQETVARYMRNQRYDTTSSSSNDGERSTTTPTAIPKHQTACVISSGMHDLTIPDLPSEIYIANHIAMKRLLKDAGCGIWIKLELTARGYRRPYLRDNVMVHEWNEVLRRSMDPDEYQINVFGRSLNAKHGDTLHMDVDTFYCPLMDFFMNLMGIKKNLTTATRP